METNPPATTTPAEDAAFRDELRAWLRENLPAGWLDQQRPKRIEDLNEEVAFRREWHKKMYAGGWAGVAWPKEYGGRALPLRQQLIFNEEMARHQAPAMLGRMGIVMLGPTIIQWGSEEQKARYLPKILSGDEIWCQGYSEPNAGSDLAALQCRAVEDGDDFLVNGQKIWTSYARYADWCFLLVRTDPEAPKHKGISYLLVDMHSPGITVRPLVQITGEQEFAEVFFDNVRVPKKNLVGEKNKGWLVAVTTLSYERAGHGSTVQLEQTLDQLVRLARRTAHNGGTAFDDPLIRDKLAQARVEIEVLRGLGQQSQAIALAGGIPGPEASVAKLFASEFQQRLAALGMEILGPYGQLDYQSPHVADQGNWLFDYFFTRALTIYGGTAEVQRNIIGERGLGLPK